MKNWKNNTINVAIQVLPEAAGKVKYELVDEAIKVIAESGFKYQVCPFETVVECTFDDLSALLESVYDALESAGTEHLINNLKIQVNFEKDVTIEDKMEKYS